MPKQIFALGKSIGVEVETTQQLPSDAQRDLPNRLFQTTHDASIESDVRISPRDNSTIIRSSSLRSLQNGQRVTMGTEIVSTPIDLETDSPDDMVKILCKWLSESGEPCMSERAGIHIHVGLGAFNMDMLHSSIYWGRHLEALFFHLAGNGYEFRGVKNNAAYCRPITKNGPPYLPSGNRGVYQKTFDIDDMLEAKSTKHFWYLYGATNSGNVGRYVPQRYIWLNWYSLLAHGTLEFRPWNVTQNAAYILAEIELCQLFTRAVIKSIPAPSEEHSAFDMRRLGYEELQHDLDHIAHLWGMTDRSYKILSMIVRRTPLMDLPNEATLSHLSYNMPWDGSFGYSPRTTNSVVTPQIVTIHTLRGEPERN